MLRLHGPTSIVRFNQFTKPLGPDLGVNRMWMRRNDHAPKVNVLIFFYYVQKGSFEKKIKFDYSFVFSWLHPLFPNKNFKKVYYNNISLPWTLASFFFLLEHLFCLSQRKTCQTMSMNNVGLKLCLLGTLNSIITLTFFPWCKLKWSWDELNNQLHILKGLGTTSWSMM